MDCKYLSDGRKVVIVGKLNNVETIVQEIFVNSAGDELPGGERFVTKSLHDEPVISWQQKEQIKLDASKDRAKQELDDTNRKFSLAYEKLKGIQAALMSAKKFAELVPAGELELFTKFLTGTAEYIVVEDYGVGRISSLVEEMTKLDNEYGRPRFEALKLLSVMGRSDGSLSYRIHSYSDGSGGGYSEIYLFNTREEALDHLQDKAIEKIQADRLSLDDYEKCIAMGMKFSPALRLRFKQSLLAHQEVADTKRQESLTKELEATEIRKNRIAQI